MRSTLTGLVAVALAVAGCSSSGSSGVDSAAQSSPETVALASLPGSTDVPDTTADIKADIASDTTADTSADAQRPSDSTGDSASQGAGAPKHLAGAVAVAFDATRNEPRPIRETVVAVDTATDVLSMKITGFSYRGVICGFSLTGEAPPSPLTIRQFVTTPMGTFDSGPLLVSWTSLDDASVSGGSVQKGAWNFDAEAHKNRSGTGWVVSIGGVTAPTGDEKDSIPTDGGCELRSTSKVFVPETGPVGYWAGFATV